MASRSKLRAFLTPSYSLLTSSLNLAQIPNNVVAAQESDLGLISLPISRVHLQRQLQILGLGHLFSSLQMLQAEKRNIHLARFISN